MKRAATLLAGLMLVTGTVFAEGMTTENGSSWDFSGTNLEWRTKLIDSQDGYMVDDSSADLLLNARWNVNENLALNFEIDTDGDGHGNGEHGTEDYSVTFIYNDENMEIGLDLALVTDGGARFLIDEGSEDTYFKFTVAEGTKLGFYPFNIGTGFGSEFETDSTLELPGITLEKDNYYAGVGSTSVRGHNVTAIKAGTQFGNFTVDYYGGLGDLDKLNKALGDANEDIIATEHALNATYSVDFAETFNFYLEGSYTMTSDAFMDKIEGSVGGDISQEMVDGIEGSGYALFAKVSNDMGRFIPYGSAKYISSGFLFDDDPSILLGINDSLLEGYHGGLTTLAAGIDFPIKDGIVLNTEIEYKMAANDVYYDLDAEKPGSSATSLAIGIVAEI